MGSEEFKDGLFKLLLSILSISSIEFNIFVIQLHFQNAFR